MSLNEFKASPKALMWKGPLVIEESICGRLPIASSVNLRFDLVVRQHYRGGAHRAPNAKPDLTYYTVTEVDHGGEMAYYLPWDNNQVTAMVLSPLRSFFFTAELSGCIFAVERQPAQKDRPKVIHIGSNRAGTKAAMLQQHFGGAANCHVFESFQDEVATAMGYLSAKGWVFLIQRRAMGFQLVTVKPGKAVSGNASAGVRLGASDNSVPGNTRDITTFKSFQD